MLTFEDLIFIFLDHLDAMPFYIDIPKKIHDSYIYILNTFM